MPAEPFVMQPHASQPMPAAPKPAGSRVFLSYSRRDAEFAVWLRQQLEAREIEVFRDVDDTLPGEQWWARLQELIARADSIVFVLSPGSVASQVCADEVRYATSLGKRIFPAVIAEVAWDAVPKGLASIHSVFFRDHAGLEGALAGLVSALNTDIAWVREHSRLGEVAMRWDRGRPADLLLRGRELEAAETWLATQPATAEAPTSLHRLLIKASRDAARRRRGILTGALAGAVVVTAGLAAWALVEQRRATASELVAVEQRGRAETNERKARAERDQALTNQSRALVERARQIEAGGDADTAMLVALEALPSLEDWGGRPLVEEAERKLWEASLRNRLIGWLPLGKLAPVIAERSNLLAVAGEDGAVAIQNSTTGELVHRLSLDGAPLRPLAFAAGGRLLLTRSTSEIHVWDAARKQLIARRSSAGEYISEALACPDAGRIALLTAGGSISIWQPQQDDARQHGAARETFGLRWQCSPDGKRLIGSSGTRGVVILDTENAAELARLPPRYGTFEPRISADGRRILLSDTDDGHVMLLLDGDGKQVAELKGHSRGVLAWAFSADGSHIATAADDMTARVWRASSGDLVATLEGHGASLNAVDIAADRKGRIRVLTGGIDGFAQLWDGRNGRPIARLTGHGAVIQSVAFEPMPEPLPGEPADADDDDIDSGFMLVASRDGVVRIWERSGATAPRAVHQLRTPAAELTTARFNATASSVIAHSAENALALWTLRARRPALELGILAMTRDGARIASVQRGAVVVQRMPDGEPVARVQLKGHTDQVRVRAAFVNQGRQLATIAGAAADRSVRIWNIETSTLSRTLDTGFDRGSNDMIATSRSGDRLAVIGGSRRLRIIDVEGHAASLSIGRDGQQFMDVAWSPDGSMLATADFGSVTLWDARTGAQLHVIATNEAFGFRAIAFSADGTRLAVLDGQRRMQLFALPERREVGSLQLDRLPAVGATVAFDPTGTRIVVPGQAVIDVASFRIVAHAREGDEGIISAHFMPDGRHAVTLDRRYGPRLQPFHLTAADIVREARARALRCLSPPDRRATFLPPEPPAWCIAGAGLESESDANRWRPLEPYRSIRWREWLVDLHNGGRPQLPTPAAERDGR